MYVNMKVVDRSSGFITLQAVDNEQFTAHLTGAPFPLDQGDIVRLLVSSMGDVDPDLYGWEDGEDEDDDDDGEVEQPASNEVRVGARRFTSRESRFGEEVTRKQLEVINYLTENPSQKVSEIEEGLGDCDFNIRVVLKTLRKKGIVKTMNKKGNKHVHYYYVDADG